MSFVVSFNGQFQKYDYPQKISDRIHQTHSAHQITNDLKTDDNFKDSLDHELQDQKRSHAINVYEKVENTKKEFKKPIHIKDLISERLITIKENQTIAKAKELMLENNIHHLPVLNDEGFLSGIISERDLIRMTKELNVSQIMNNEVIIAYETARVSDAAKIMLYERCGCLPIINDNNHLEGVITMSDILKYVIEIDEFNLYV